MKTVYKYAIPTNSPDKLFTLDLPVNAKFLKMGKLIQNNEPYFAVWFEIEYGADLEKRSFKIFGTGMDIEGTHLDTIFEPPFVWHLYEI